jgi:hypothetical protein
MTATTSSRAVPRIPTFAWSRTETGYYVTYRGVRLTIRHAGSALYDENGNNVLKTTVYPMTNRENAELVRRASVCDIGIGFEVDGRQVIPSTPCSGASPAPTSRRIRRGCRRRSTNCLIMVRLPSLPATTRTPARELRGQQEDAERLMGKLTKARRP